MKKILGLAVLATMPVACGTIPTSPEATLGATPSAEAPLAASGRGRAVPAGCTTEPDWASVVGITLGIVRSDQNSVTVRAELLMTDDTENDRPVPCFNPTFSLNSIGRATNRPDATLTSGWDRQEATLTGRDGKYLITVVANSHQRMGLTTSLQVELPQPGLR